jgi:hypothetical protein
MLMKSTTQLKRHPANPNLHLWYEKTYRGLAVMESQAPLIREYLETLYDTTMRALEDHGRVFAVRFDLRFPSDCLFTECDYTNQAISKFVASLKSKIGCARTRAKRASPYAHDTSVSLVWAREHGSRHEHCSDGRQHYHFVLLLNWDAYRALGSFNSGKINLFTHIQGAWAQAMRIGFEDAKGLVYVPENAGFKLIRDGGEGDELAAFFLRASYICKARSKVYGNGFQTFRGSNERLVSY